jgi:putative membrane protein
MPAASRSCAWLMLALLAGLALTAPGAWDPGIWVLEVAPILVVMPVLWFTRRRFPLTDLSYALILVQALIMMVGGHYTYARVPLGFWAQEAFHLARNDYDRLGHLAQGLVPALCAREILLRCTPLRRGGWLFFITTAICLAISACYEFVEWWSALLLGSGADEFLATQGDPWDTQADMFMALLGALLGQLLLARWQDRQLARQGISAGVDARVV